ncbi:hypothetical protein [Shouchella patagoniensis]|uniref:hypothetical protein n=1 Tax=Shouchella patagoniensis TaxID=228576 RepID=UPI0009955BD3|nr:hypothetical protein [Shouchella patagoniensis]
MKKAMMLGSVTVATSLFAVGCSQEGSGEYVDALAQKEEGTKFSYTVELDVTTPSTTEGMHEVLSHLATHIEDLDLGYTVTGDRDQGHYEIDQALPRQATLVPYPVQMDLTGALLEGESFYLKTEEMIAFENEQGTYGFTLETTPEVEDTYVELTLTDIPYTPEDLLERNEDYEALIEEVEGESNGEGEMTYVVDGEEASTYFKEIMKKSMTYSFPGIVELLDEEMEAQVTIGEVTINSQLDDGNLQKETYTIPFTENDREWEMVVAITYNDLDYSGDISTIDDEDLLDREAYNDYIVSEQQRDLEKFINSTD